MGWKAGYAEIDITPTYAMAMSGFGRPRAAVKALDPLQAQAMALQDVKGNRFVFVAADIMAFDRTSVVALRTRLTQAHGLPPEAVTFAASHTHWGPHTVYHVSFTAGGFDPWYVGALEDKIIALVDNALADLSPATVKYHSFDAQIGANRRSFDHAGNQLWLPNLEGFYDTHTPLLCVSRAGHPVAEEIVLLSHACHPTSTGRAHDMWSADYPGHLRRALRRRRGPLSRCMFAMGCGADAKVTYQPPKGELVFANSPRESRLAGQKLARDVDKALASATSVDLPPSLAVRSHTGKLTFARHWSAKRLHQLAYHSDPANADRWWARQQIAFPDHRAALPYEVQAVTLGDTLTLITLEGEVCSPLGPLARGLARTEHSMVIAYANAVEGYIPSKTILKEGGYEGESSHRAYFLPATFTKDIEKEFLATVGRAIGGK